jgi:hypothetical protein
MHNTASEAETLNACTSQHGSVYTKWRQPHALNTHQEKILARIIVTIKVKTVRVGIPQKPGRLSPRSAASLPGNRKLRGKSKRTEIRSAV